MNRFQQVSVGEKDPDLAFSLQVGMLFSAFFGHLIRLLAEACSCGPCLHHGLLPPDFHDAQCFQRAIA